MLEVLEFIFRNFWTWLGTAILLEIVTWVKHLLQLTIYQIRRSSDMGSDLSTDRWIAAMKRDIGERDKLYIWIGRLEQSLREERAAVESRIQSAVQQARQEERAGCLAAVLEWVPHYQKSGAWNYVECVEGCADAIRSRASQPEPRT